MFILCIYKKPHYFKSIKIDILHFTMYKIKIK